MHTYVVFKPLIQKIEVFAKLLFWTTTNYQKSSTSLISSHAGWEILRDVIQKRNFSKPCLDEQTTSAYITTLWLDRVLEQILLVVQLLSLVVVLNIFPTTFKHVFHPLQGVLEGIP